MDVKELKRLLSYFSEDIEVEVELEKNLFEIKEVKGTASETGLFTVKLDLKR